MTSFLIIRIELICNLILLCVLVARRWIILGLTKKNHDFRNIVFTYESVNLFGFYSWLIWKHKDSWGNIVTEKWFIVIVFIKRKCYLFKTWLSWTFWIRRWFNTKTICLDQRNHIFFLFIHFDVRKEVLEELKYFWCFITLTK